MKKYIAFLRAINVGGHNVKMDQLKKLFEELGFNNVETFIASGNVIFDFKPGDAGTLEKKIENHLFKSLGYEVSTFLRTNSELEEIVKYKPFSETKLNSAQAFNVAFIKQSITSELKKKLSEFKTDVDNFHTNDREVFWLCKVKQSDSKFSNVLFERKLKIQATFRGIKTVTKLAVKYPTE